MLRTVVIQVDGTQAEALRKLLVRGDGLHGDPLSAWGSLGELVARRFGPTILDQLSDQSLDQRGP